MATRLSIESVEKKTSPKSGKDYWRAKCSDGQYYTSFTPMGMGVYDLTIADGIIKKFVPVGDVAAAPAATTPNQAAPSFSGSSASTGEGTKKEMIASYAMTLACKLISDETTTGEAFNKWLDLYIPMLTWVNYAPERAQELYRSVQEAQTKQEPF